jgi:hypothetical protein
MTPRKGRTGLGSSLGLNVSDSDLLKERRSVGVLGVVDVVVLIRKDGSRSSQRVARLRMMGSYRTDSEVGSESSIGPGEVAGGADSMVLVGDELDHVVSSNLGVALDV